MTFYPNQPSRRCRSKKQKIVSEARTAYRAGEDGVAAFTRIGQRYGVAPQEVANLVINAIQEEGRAS